MGIRIEPQESKVDKVAAHELAVTKAENAVTLSFREGDRESLNAFRLKRRVYYYEYMSRVCRNFPEFED